MATLLRASSRVRSGERRIALDHVIENGPRPGREDPEADRIWLELRRAIDAATERHPEFHVRRVLTLSPLRAKEWQAARHAWIRRTFADDPRVDRTTDARL